MTFMSLEEFMLHPEDDDPTRPVYQPLEAEEWVYRYYQAKESFETYGDNPPPGEVYALWSGMGTTLPTMYSMKKNHLTVKILEGVYHMDTRYFLLSNPSNKEHKSLVHRKSWWRMFKVKS